MRAARRYAVAVIAAGLGGIVSALWMSGWVTDEPPFADAGRVEAGGWRTSTAIGSEAADPYLRAWVARRGLLALPREAAVYYSRSTDESGAALTESCAYVIEGAPPDGAWWSVTLYAGDDYLARNDDAAPSLDATRAVLGEGGLWRAAIQDADPGDGAAWISSRNAGDFTLTYRIYAPGEGLLADPAGGFDPPRLVRLGCREGA